MTKVILANCANLNTGYVLFLTYSKANIEITITWVSNIFLVTCSQYKGLSAKLGEYYFADKGG